MFGHGFNVLVLDDDEDDCFLICETISEIEGDNYQVATAHTPSSAIEKIRANSFHAILCDYRLGATSGIDFINEVRAQGWEIPIILLTGMEDSATDSKALEAGAADFISKSALSTAILDRAIRYAVANAERQKLLSTVLTSVDAAVCVLDGENTPVLWNPSFLEVAKKQGNFEDGNFIDGFAKRLMSSESVHSVGEQILEKRITQLPDGGCIITLLDVTEHIEALREREKAEKTAAHLANHCSLTGLPNRVAFARHVEKKLESCKDADTGCHILNLDLNNFKEVNDIHGHSVGDALLKLVATRFSNCLEDGDYLARLGGDEFVAIQSSFSPDVDTPDLANRLLRAIEEPFHIAGKVFRPGVSIGVANYPIHGSNSQELLSKADIAMYRAKDEPNSNIHCYNSQLDESVRHRRLVASELKGALERGDLEVHFQPQACLKTGTISGMEALCRWVHPTLGSISPSVFIPIAEENGLINEIGSWVLRQSCQLAADWPVPVTVSVNLSALQIRYNDVVKEIQETLLETGLPACRLELEVTESVILDDFEHALHVLRRIRNLGVSLALDDFGTGFSSLSTITSFPFNKLKIDRSFVMELEQNRSLSTVTKAIIGLGKNLNLKIIAEGVESISHLEFLSLHDCDHVQGYLLGKAMPQRKAIEFLKAPPVELLRKHRQPDAQSNLHKHLRLVSAS